jgi:Tfp pilus assembly protein PilF
VTAKAKTTSTPGISAVEDGFDSEELLALALVDMEKGDLAPALSKLKRAVAADVPAAEAFSACAKLYAKLRLWNRAQQMYEKYLSFEPEAVAETFQLGMVHFDAGRPSEALKIWDDQLKKNPNFPPALFYRALLLAQTGKPDAARQSLETLIKTAPADNLYFGRAKELLQNIDARQTQKPAGEIDARAALVKDAYKTEH